MGGIFRFLRDELILATRTVIRRPGEVVAPILILTLAVALNALVFSVVRGVLLAPLPFQASERVVVAEEVGEGGGLTGTAYPILEAWRREAPGVEAMTAYLETTLPLLGSSGPIHVDGAKVTEGFFRLLDRPLRSGRTFSPGDHAVGSGRVVAISEGLWERAFGRDPGILDRMVEVEGERHQVVAVVRNDRVFPDQAEIWIPVEPSNPDLLEVAGAKIFVTLARVRPGVGPEALSSALEAISRQVVGGAPEARVAPLEDRLLGDVRTPLLLLQGAVLLVLLAPGPRPGLQGGPEPGPGAPGRR